MNTSVLGTINFKVEHSEGHNLMIFRSNFQTSVFFYSLVIALGKAHRILQGESPCRERSNQPPVSSVDLVEGLGN